MHHIVIICIVTKVSANVLTNQVTGTNCNQAEIVPKLGEIENLAVLNWCPACQLKRFWNQTNAGRSPPLVKPITGYYNKAFHED